MHCKSLLRAVRKIQQMAHSDKRVRQGLAGSDSFISVEPQHPFQQVDELPPICLLSQHVRALQVRGQIDLEQDWHQGKSHGEEF